MGSSLSTEPGESKYDSFKRREATWGVAPEVVRYFFSGLPQPQPTFDNAEIVTSFKLPYVGGKPDTMGCLEGRYDNAFRTFFQSLSGTVWWSFWHEVEDDIEEGRITLAQWKSCFERMYAISQEFDNLDGRDLRVTVILMGWTANPASGRILSKYTQNFPVDAVGWDVYPDPNEASTIARFKLCSEGTKNVFGINNYMICETGANNKTYAPAVIAEHIRFAVAEAYRQGFSKYIYYDATDPGNPSWDSRLLTDVQHQAIADTINNY